MTREETKKILMIVTSTYANFKPQNMSFTVDAWAKILSEYSYRDVEQSLMTYIASSNSEFAPSVSQLIGGVHKITNKLPEYENEEEAWAKVYKAICNGTYNSVEEFNKLPAVCQKAIGSPDNLRELAQSDLDTIQSVEKSNFMRVYRSELAKQIEIDKIPQQIRAEYQLENRKQILLEKRPDDDYETGVKEHVKIDFSKLVADTVSELTR